MACDHSEQGKVLETRRHEGAIYRRRWCYMCEQRYVTVETIHTGPIPKPRMGRAGLRGKKEQDNPDKLQQDKRMADGAAALASVFK